MESLMKAAVILSKKGLAAGLVVGEGGSQTSGERQDPPVALGLHKYLE